MEKTINYSKPLFQATLADLKIVIRDVILEQQLESPHEKPSLKKYVYGIAGIAQLLGCSIPTAQRIKSSGELDEAISQTGKILIVDSEMALDLLRLSKKWGRNCTKK